MKSSTVLLVGVVFASAVVARTSAAQELYSLEGEYASQLGFSLSPAGDVNDDGLLDSVCGRPYWQLDARGSPETLQGTARMRGS